MSTSARVFRMTTTAIALLVISVGAAPGQTWDAGTGAGDPAGDQTLWFRDFNWNTNVLPGLGSTTLDTNQTITYTGTDNLRIFYRILAGSADPGIASFRGQVPAGLTYVFKMTKDPQLTNTLTTTVANGNFFHDGAGTYTVQIDAASELRVGDPTLAFLPAPVNADLYGFKLDLDGTITGIFTPAVVRSTRRLGCGPVDVLADTSSAAGLIVVGVAGNPLFPGTIDCAFNAGAGVDPVTASPWRVTSGNGGFARLDVVSGSILNVGNWNLNFGLTTPTFFFGVPYANISTSRFELSPANCVSRA